MKPARPAILILLLTLLAASVAGCAEERERVRLYHTAPVAPSLSAESIQALEHMGPTLVDNGVHFAVFSAHATRMQLLLFDDPEAERPTKRFEMERLGDVWSLYVEGIGEGQHYGYVAWGPNWTYDEAWFPGSIHGFKADVDDAGNRFNPNKLLIDPYAKAIHRDHDWSRASLATGPHRTQSTWGAGSKSVVVESDYAWSEAEHEWRRKKVAGEGYGHNELVVYEVHLKGFTADGASGVTHPGTYSGFAEKAAYLKELGVTAVELLPIHEKPLDGGYWGYNNLSFFAPEITYSATQDPLEVVDEVKAMVDALHQHGIEVWVDVVYNHTGEGGLWRSKIELNDTHFGSSSELVNHDPHEVAGLYSYRGLDNASYYALSPDGQTYWNNTGVGNQVRANHGPSRKLIIDSLRYMVEELHIDGFRFDLAPVLGEKDQFYDEWAPVDETVLQEIIDDPVLEKYDTRIVAEPWSIQGFYLGRCPVSSDGERAWGEWNAYYRDWWRSFINEDGFKLNTKQGGWNDQGAVDGGGTLTGSHDLFAPEGRKPYHSMNFITVHDGFTLYDLVSYNEKRNGCGPLNPVCCDDPNSAWCERDSGESHNRSRDWGEEATKRQMMRNFFTAMFISHGTPLLLGGDEWMRTQLGNNNAYSTGADNPYNWYQWGNYIAKDEAHRMKDFVAKMTRFRREHAYALAPVDWDAAAPFAWKSAQNTEPPNWDSRHLMIHYYDDTVGPEIAILINMERDWTEFTLPGGREWKRVVDTQSYFDDVAYLSENADDLKRSYNATLDAPEIVAEPTYRAAPSSFVILTSE